MDKIEITPELLAQLKEKAQKATPGDWMELCGNSVITHDYNIAAYVVRVDDARHIAAANPQVVLALIEEFGRLDKEADWLAMELEKREHGCEWCGVSNCSRYTSPCGYKGPDNWRNAARKAIEDAYDAMEAEREARER